MKKILKTALLLAFICTSFVNAETISMSGKEDFDYLETVWWESYQEGNYEPYQEYLAAIASSVISDDSYQYMLAEALFYKYYASSFITMPENEELDASLEQTIAYCVSIEESYPVLRTVVELFRSLQQTAPFKNTTPAIVLDGEPEIRPVKVSMLPDASDSRLLMLRTLAEVEAMSQRLKIASESRGGEVQMKLKDTAYMSVMEKPAMVYVINHEPLYTELKKALDESAVDFEPAPGEEDDWEPVSFGSYADAFYEFESLVKHCQGLCTITGIDASALLSEEAYKAMLLYDSDPFAVLCLNEDALEQLNLELKFFTERCLMFVERINRLPEKREGSL